MNSTDLAFFAAVAETGGIGRAAAALNTVQSNVTAHIRGLEQALQTPLFYRGTRGVTLTQAGERLLPYATQVTRLLADARQAVLSDKIPRGALRLGSMETTAALRLPRLLATYARSFPEVDIELELGPTATLVTSVLERKIEGAFVAGPIGHDDLAAIPILEEELVLIASPKFRSGDDLIAMLAGKRGARALVFRSGCSYRARLDAFLAAHGLAHVRKIEFGTLDGIIGCIEAGMGVSMLPRIVAEPMERGNRISIHPLPGRAGQTQTLLIYRKDSLLTAAFDSFVETIANVFGRLPARTVAAVHLTE